MIKKAICPNCGAEGTVGRYCEFCGTKIPVPIVKQTTNSKQGNLLIVEDRLTTENLIAGLPNALANQEDVSTDVFDDIEVKNVTKYIIPMYAYNGTFQAPWSCVKLVEETYKVGDEKRHRTKRYPMNGVASGTYAYLFPSCNLDNMPSELKSFILTEISNEGDITDYAISRSLTDLEEDSMVEDTNDTEGVVWRNFDGSNLIESKVSKAVHYQLPISYEDFSSSYTTNGTKGTKVFVPVWLLNYTHKGKNYAFVIDGTLQNKVLEHPIDQEYVDNVKDWSDTSDSMSLYGILLAIVDAIIGVVSLGCLISTITRLNMDSDGELGFRLFWADILFFVFAFCLFKTKDFWHKSKLADSAVEIAKIDHKQKVLDNFRSNIIEQNRLGLSAETLNAVTGLFKKTFKETSDKLYSMQPSKDIKTGKWIRPFVIVLFIIYVLVNIGFISGSVHRANLEKQKRELAIKDSIENARAEEREAQLQKELNKPKVRPVAPSPSLTDAEILGYKNACKITYIERNEMKTIKFDSKGQVCEVEKVFNKDDANKCILTYRLNNGKVVSYTYTSSIPGSPYQNYQTHESYKYKIISLTKDEITYTDDNGNCQTKAYIEYDAKGRVSTINTGIIKHHFSYDSNNIAIYKEQQVIPVLYLIGQYDMPSISCDVKEVDNYGRPTEIIAANDTMRINYR